MAHRCYLEKIPTVAGEQLAIEGEEAHHLIQVLRIKVGDALTLHDGKGGVAEAQVEQVNRRDLLVRVGEINQVPRPDARITLIQAVPKGKRLDLVLQKAVELGVQEIVLVQTTNVVSRVKPSAFPAKLERWNQILVAALKQSGNPWLPNLALRDDWEAVIQEQAAANDAVLLGDLSPEADCLKEILVRLAAGDSSTIACAIGPEGDFTSEETEQAKKAGCISINLGPRVLRTETAALYMMSVLAYEFLN